MLTKHSENEKIKKYRATGDKKIKSKVLAYTPAGDYGDNSRSIKSKLVSATKLVQLDFDIKTTAKRVKELFDKYTWIAVASPSCSGKGFYLLVNTPDVTYYEEYFQALVNFFQSDENLQVDIAVSSINELRFVSLTNDVLYREDATLWEERIELERGKLTDHPVPLDGEVIEFEKKDIGKLHYVDLVCFAGKNNSNGTPLEKVLAYVTPQMFNIKSHLRKANASYFENVLTHIYDRYADQHGETVVPVTGVSTDISLPPIKIKGKMSSQEYALKVVKNVFEAYLIKTDEATKKSYRFNNFFWEEIPESQLRNFLTQCSIASSISITKSELTDFRDKMLIQLQDLTAVKFETPLNMFNLKNGVLKFEAGGVTFVEHSSDYLFTYILDYDYDPKAKDSKILNDFLIRTIPNAASLSSLFQYIGSAFSDIQMELFLIILGSGANGKSTLMNLLASCLGGAVGQFNLDTLTDTNPEIAAKEARNIYNRILAFDTESSRIRDPRLWRKLISKEAVSVKYLYKDIFETRNYARLISCMNETPYIDTLEGSARRVLAIQTGATLRRDEYDLLIGKKLHEARTQMLNKIIAGYVTFYKQHGIIMVSDESKAQTADILEEHNIVFQYMKAKHYFLVTPITDNSSKTTRLQKYQIENAKVNRKAGVKTTVELLTLTTLYTEFRDFCTDEGISENKIYTKRLFVRRLKSATKLPYSHEGGVIHITRDSAEVYPLGKWGE